MEELPPGWLPCSSQRQCSLGEASTKPVAAYIVGGITPAIRSCWYFIGWLLPARALVELAFEGLDRLRAHGTCPSGDRARSVSPSCGRLRRAVRLVLGAFPPDPFAAPALVLALCWLPVLVGYAPALFMWDTNTQILQWFGLPNHISSSVDLLDSSVLLTQHHPPLHTALVGLCVQAGISLAGSENLGIFIYAVLQWIVDILAISWAFRIAQSWARLVLRVSWRSASSRSCRHIRITACW